MHQTRFFWKLYAAFVAIIALVATSQSLFLARQIERESLTEIDTSLRAWTLFLREVATPYLITPSPTQLHRELYAVGAHMETRLTVIDDAGTVLADSASGPDSMDNHLSRPELVAAREKGSGIITRYSHTLQQPMRCFALPVRENGELIGYVRVALPLTVIRNRIDSMRVVVATVAIYAALLALALALILARRISLPLGAMMKAAQAIAGGHYQERLNTRSRDEFGALASAFNSMAEQLEARVGAMARDRNEVLAILGSMVEGVIAVDLQQQIVQINEVAAEMLETTVRESIGRPIWEVTRCQQISAAVASVMRDGSEVTDEMPLFRPPADLRIEIHASPLYDKDNQPAGAVVVLHDVTRLHQLESIRRDFVTNVSHEFKTPVTAIRALVETLIEDRAIEPATQERFLGKIKSQCDRLTALVDDLLALSRAELPQGGIEPGIVDLREPALDALRLLAASAEDRSLRVEQQLAAAPVPVLGDREGLREVASNLLDNAIKYTLAGGTVWIRVHRADSEAVLEVEDTGIGIEPRHIDRIFERFYRIDKARSRQLGGTGLGLSIVKHTVQGMGGQVSVKSTPGQGSAFRVTLPLAAESAPASQAPG